VSESIVVQRPAAPVRLILLFHGVGSSAPDLEPLGRMIASAFPDAFVVSVNAPHPSDLGRGYQWFSVGGITEENRRGRVDAAQPAFRRAVAQWQQSAGLGPAATALVGFSQGAIMSLESTLVPPALCSRVVALAGRFVAPPPAVVPGIAIHLIHGDADRVVPHRHTVENAAHLARLGVAVSADTIAGAGHQITPEVAARAILRLGPA